MITLNFIFLFQSEVIREIMKKVFLFIAAFCFSSGLVAQMDRSTGPTTTVKGFSIPAQTDNSMLSAPKSHSLSILNQNGLFTAEKDTISFAEEKKPLKMTTDNGLMTYTQEGFTPKAFTRDKEIVEAYGKDQYLGDYTTGGKFVEVYCRDHEFVDGDKVRIIINGVVAQQSVTLGAGHTPIFVKLNSGFNTIEFQALNQGTSGPNTAELTVLDEKGEVLAKKEWNLLTGAKASIVVVKK